MAILVLTASLMSNPVVAWRSSLVARIKVVTCLRGMDGPEDGEGPPMNLFNSPGPWMDGPEGQDMPPPGEPTSAEDLFMMFEG